MTDYNGFTGAERHKGGNIQTWAYKKGYLKRPLNCEACHVYGDVPGEIVAHLEDYTEPIKGSIFLCYRCHRMVHIRHQYPEAWYDYRKKVGGGFHWPLATNKPGQVVHDHCDNRLKGIFDAGAVSGYARGETVLDRIDDGTLHPGPREKWVEKMALIMDGKRPFFIPTDQLSFL